MKSGRNRARTAARISSVVLTAITALLAAVPAWAVEKETLPANDAIMQACADEMARTLTLHMEDLEKPYFVSFVVDDNLHYSISAAYGALVSSSRTRYRTISCDVRVGDYKLDNTNFVGDGGGWRGGGRGGSAQFARLPVDDDPIAIRQAIWAAADESYKSAVETLSRKQAYMKDKHLTDRPEDFTKMPAITATEPAASMAFDRAAWERDVQALSARFKRHPQIQDSKVELRAGLANSYILNSEGTRVRKADTGVILSITAECQAEDGMRLSDDLSYVGLSPADLPSIDELTADIDELVENLTTIMKAPILENYSGPVLFDAQAAGQMFESMLARGVAGRAEPLGMGRRGRGGAEDLERQLGSKILPKFFNVYDDPTIEKLGDKLLAGAYKFDDEGVPAKRVDVAVKGVLKDLCMSRTPTKKLSGSNGHGRGSMGSTRAQIACLFIEDAKGVSDEKLKEKLIDAAKEADLEYGIRVVSLQSAGGGNSMAQMMAMFGRRGGRRGGGGGASLGDPLLAYKVFVDDGHEEPIRGCEFGEVDVKELKKILAGGNTQDVYNVMSGAGASSPAAIIAPSVLFEELELNSIEQENEKLPILKAPSARTASTRVDVGSESEK